MWKFIVILNLHLLVGSTDLIDGPRNMVVGVGQRMEMKCQAGSSSIIREWTLQRSFTLNIETIFVYWKDRGKINNPHFGIVESLNGSVVLYTNSTEMDDAGIYTCAVQKVGRQPDRYSAQLIVFETEPLCETSLSSSENNIVEEGTHIWMLCAVKFAGKWAPTLDWTLHRGNGETTREPRELTDWVDVVIIPNLNISSTLTILLNETSNASYYSCKIFYPSGNRSELVTANNSPDYRYRWNSPLVTVIPSARRRLMTTKNINGMDLKTISVVVLSILFGATFLSVVVIIIYTRRNKSPAAIPIGPNDDQNPDEYHTITYDGYDTIEEVDINDDVITPHCSSRGDSLPKPNYYALTPTKPDANWIYTDIDTYEQPVDKRAAITEKNLSDAK